MLEFTPTHKRQGRGDLVIWKSGTVIDIAIISAIVL